LSLVTHRSREWFRLSYRRRMLPVLDSAVVN